MLTAIILEDEPIASRRLKRMLEELYGDQLEVIKTFQALTDLAEYLMKNAHPDILFQDIMVADGNSFDLFDIVDIKSAIIFTTAYDEFAIDALRKDAVDYLLKPIKKEELARALDRAAVKQQEELVQLREEIYPFRERFLIRFGNKLHSVRTKDVAYIYSEDKLSFFILKDGKRVPSDLRLQDIHEALDPKLFFRANRQFVVSLESIKEMSRYSRSRINLRLEPDYPQDIIISTENTPRFKQWMDR